MRRLTENRNDPLQDHSRRLLADLEVLEPTFGQKAEVELFDALGCT